MLQKSMRHFAQALGVYQPLDRTMHCLNIWLKENGRVMCKTDRRRAAGLMARYFHYEDGVTDQLMLSFLNHYAGNRVIDMDDPASVRMELKAVLDRSIVKLPAAGPVWLPAAAGVLVTVLVFVSWDLSQRTVTPVQQEALRRKVEKIAAMQDGVSRAAVWSMVKKPLKITKYQNMSYWDYDDVDKKLDGWLARLGAGM